jgi:hypothetical protein
VQGAACAGALLITGWLRELERLSLALCRFHRVRALSSSRWSRGSACTRVWSVWSNWSGTPSTCRRLNGSSEPASIFFPLPTCRRVIRPSGSLLFGSRAEQNNKKQVLILLLPTFACSNPKKKKSASSHPPLSQSLDLCFNHLRELSLEIDLRAPRGSSPSPLHSHGRWLFMRGG